MHVLLRHWPLILLATAGLALVIWPAGDLWSTSVFYNPVAGFTFKQHPVNRFIYEAVEWVSRTVIVGLLVFLLLAWTARKTDAFFLAHRKAALYLLLVALIGPLFLVNSVFKDQWGRARPSQVVEFGGAKQFSRATIPADQCAKNCSFVSGHASTGFFFLAPAFVFIRRRHLWLAAGTTGGLAIGLVRMMQGGHFLSDVLFSGVVVYLTAWALHAVMYRRSGAT